MQTFNRYEDCKSGNKQNASNKEKGGNFERNPREPGQFSFEFIKYIIDEAMVNRLRSRFDKSYNYEDNAPENVVQDEIITLHLASDFKTGLMREIKSLVDLDMITINESGLPSLKDGWERNIHPFILNEMWEAGWNEKEDPENKFCIHTKIRDAIEVEWQHSPEGWLCRSMQKVCHSHQEFERIRRVFESNFDDVMNEVDGIAQFGI